MCLYSFCGFFCCWFLVLFHCELNGFRRLNSFVFIELCFMALERVYFGDSVCDQQECVFCLCCLKYSIDICLVHLFTGMVQLWYFFLLLLLKFGLIDLFVRMGYYSPYSDCICVCLFMYKSLCIMKLGTPTFNASIFTSKFLLNCLR